MATNNDASQTLFRMVSLRNPQLTEITTKNFGFVQRPNETVGFFDNAVKNDSAQSTKLEAMMAAASSFSESFKTENELESGPYGKLLIIGRKISRNEILKDNEWKYTKDYYQNLIDAQSKSSNKTGVNELSALWDNLIYQVITQKDFYIKEAISHILQAIHIGFAQSIAIDEEIIKINGEKPLEKSLDAKIVLPKELFKEDYSDPSNIKGEMAKNSNSLSPNTAQRLINEAKTDLLVKEALHKKERLTKLNIELKKLEKPYHQLRNKEYDSAYDKYKKEYQPKIDAYERELREVEAQVEENDLKSKNTRLSDKLARLEVPPFEFTYKSEINIENLKSDLSRESFSLFLSLFADNVIDIRAKAEAILLDFAENQIELDSENISINDEIATYNAAINEIDNQISEQIETALEASPLLPQQYVNLGGALIPVSNTIARTPLAYTFTAIPTRYNFFWTLPSYVHFSFEVENSSWNVVSANVVAETDKGYFEETYTDIAAIDNKVILPACLFVNFDAISRFRVEINFGNGRFAHAELLNIKIEAIITGLLSLKSLSTSSTSKRNNFGIKRLGVADYLKVVQSVHAYVPGLVSNIENVMASELRHKSSVARDYSEIIDTTSKSQETEKVSDTSKTSRSDMQSEVAREIDKQQAITAHTRFNYDKGAYKFEIGAEYANNTAQHDSTRQAVMKSQEVTERAMERVLTKIGEERVQKIIKEYTETNVHEYDNRGKVTVTNNADAAQPKHITGVYRWIDIKHKNQIYNYGIRTMFEFMIPEPARLHRLALSVAKGQILTAPIDPRKETTVWKMVDAKTASTVLIQHWADIYKVELTESLPSSKEVKHTAAGVPAAYRDPFNGQTSFSIPENYVGKSASFICNSQIAKNGYNSDFFVSNLKGGFEQRTNGGSGSVYYTFQESLLNLTANIDYFVKGWNVYDYTVQVKVNCELSDEYKNKWKTESFNTIIKAYDDAYAKFQENQAKLDEEQKQKEEEQKAKLGQFYRYMEQDVLKHNCIAYLLQDYLSPKTVGQNYTVGDKMENFAVNLSDNLDKYAALAKFMEQAFEWEIMDYTFYPYYWANREKWQEMYVSDSMDLLFRSFLQSGMARVIATVRPGFESALQFFLETGFIWNGGEVPVIGDPMYMSIVDEMRKPLGMPQGKYWISKIPTSLTIIQDKSTGLKTTQALPIFPESNPSNCENPSELVFESSFDARDIQMISSSQPTTLHSNS